MSQHSDIGSPLVLLADDGAPAADVAWAWLISHRWDGWTQRTITVQSTLYPGGPALRLSRHVHRQPPAEAGFVTWDHVDREGDPRTVLLGQSDASLILVGSHHHGHLAGMLAGSTSEWLLVHPPAPLLLAPHGHLTRSAVLCVDGSSHSRRALDVFVSLPWSVDVSVSLVSVEDGVTDTEQVLARSAAAFAGRTPPELVSLAGDTKKEITAFARAHEVDLVVLGTRGLSGLRRMSVGSTVSALVKDDMANLLIAHVDEADESAWV